MDKTFLFIVAIFMHKGAAGMSLGISMTKAFPDRNKFVISLMALFSIFTPIGIVIGWSLDNGSDITELIFNCLAGGTFLYISCSEVIIEEFSLPNLKLVKLFFFIVGIALIASLKFIDPG